MMMFAAGISAQLQRIEGRTTPWVFVQLMGGVMGNVPFALTGIIWTVAAFRPDRSPEITQAINDAAGYYYFFYDWRVTSGCASDKFPVSVHIDIPPVIASASPDTICFGDFRVFFTASSGCRPEGFRSKRSFRSQE